VSQTRARARHSKGWILEICPKYALSQSAVVPMVVSDSQSQTLLALYNFGRLVPFAGTNYQSDMSERGT
jgi:hypothetical protein